MIVSAKTYLSWSFTCVARVERCLYKSFWKTSPKFSKNWIFLISQHLSRIMTDPAEVPGRIGYSTMVDLGTPGGGWTKIVLRGDLRVLSGVPGGFRHSGGGLDLS